MINVNKNEKKVIMLDRVFVKFFIFCYNLEKYKVWNIEINIIKRIIRIFNFDVMY